MNLDIAGILIQVVVFLFAISVHESAHAWTASRFGDPTARLLGRVSLNPIRHIDPLGTVILPLMALIYHFPMIGWAKPTPVDPRNFGSNYVFADVMTSVAGPVSNFLVASCAVLGLVAMALSSPVGRAAMLAAMMGGTIEGSQSPLIPLAILLYEAMIINVLLAVFNLIPIPPLDGSHVVRHMLSDPMRSLYDRVGWVGLILFFLVGGRVIGVMMSPFLHFFNSLLLRFA
jgi:Zn-dependent protease